MRNPTQAVTSRCDLGIVGGCVAADVVSVAIFVLVGRLSHDESIGPAGLLTTGWPFLIGVVGGYIGVALTRWPALSLASGAVVVGKTLIIGLVLRYGVQRAGTPLSFVIVTCLVLGALMMGWRRAPLAVPRRNRQLIGA